MNIDLRKKRVMPVNCKDTGKVMRVTRRGRYVYKQQCDFQEKGGGHRLKFKPVKGLKLKKGDLVTGYLRAKKIKGSDIYFDAASIVHSSRKGKTRWLMGVPTSKPCFTKKDGDYRVVVLDDAETPPKVKRKKK